MAQTATIIGSGNIGTDLMKKLTKREGNVKLATLVGTDPNSLTKDRTGQPHDD